ncbi:hypothetical protein BLA60_08415 [Actinophytocola xinjiangensis]|uniref:DUF4349 domain-containing protein n=1 Tax=Actinophytocola xinjiangensis TaxID=485602 RepID=A0A7Z1AZS1_9PSEU|nr:hypothetical protein BLA60_08415 [Actinophytocola xinjiangensis]
MGVAAGLAACTGSSGGPAMSSDSASGGEAQMAPAEAAKPGAEADQSGEVAPVKKVEQPGVDRKLVRTANLALSAPSVAEVVDGARGIAATEGGYAGREEVREESATLTLHIPSDRFDAALGELSELGEVVSRDQTAEDVTEQVVDLDSRVATQRASVDRVRALLARAGTVEEIVRIEQEVTAREAELESLTQRRQALGGQVAMSTVTIAVSRDDTAPPPVETEEESSGFVAGLSDGWDAFLGAGGVLLRVLGAVLPFVLVLAIPGVPLVRWWRRRRAAVANAAVAPAVPQP